MKKLYLIYLTCLVLLCGQVAFSSSSLQEREKGETVDFFQPLTLQKLKALHLWGNVSTDILVGVATFFTFMRFLYTIILKKDYFWVLERVLFVSWTSAFFLSTLLRAILFAHVKAKTEKGEKYRKKTMQKQIFLDIMLLSIAVAIGGIMEGLSWKGKISWLNLFDNNKKKYIPFYAFLRVCNALGSLGHLISMGIKYLPRKKPKK